MRIEEVLFFQTPMTLKKSRYQRELKPKGQKKTPEKQFETSSLPQSLKTYKEKYYQELVFSTKSL